MRSTLLHGSREYYNYVYRPDNGNVLVFTNVTQAVRRGRRLPTSIKHGEPMRILTQAAYPSSSYR